MLVCHPKRSPPVDAECKQPEEVGISEPISLANGTILKVVAKNAGETALPYHQDIISSQNDAPWYHNYLSLPIRGISFLYLIDSYSNWP
ncbi:unnamed protein product [Hymenolepis diminuta]|uniref:Uncharacterized protein n=1 Tax=Hymenolepis diminuta TaxID=6216 RepID=A0A564YWY0_HYMDI|nr:unnamed protein product [Hymenolepis diminuta]